MAASEAAELLARVKDALAFESQAQYGVEADLPPQVLAEHAVSTRHAHKFMLMQLQVLKFCLDFLDSGLCVENASKSSVRQEVAEAKQEWKKLKAEYQQQVESIQKDVPQLLLKLEQAWNRAQLLEEALQRYQDKKLEMEEKARSAQKRQQKEQDALYEQQRRLEERMAELQGSLQAQREELQQLRRELEEEERQACAWQEEVQRISDFRSLLETLQGVRLLSESKSDLEFELISPAQPGAATPHALKLRLHWRDDGSVMLQSDSPFFPPSLVLPEGTCGNIRAIVLELQNSYFQQAQLLAEIELLHSCPLRRDLRCGTGWNISVPWTSTLLSLPERLLLPLPVQGEERFGTRTSLRSCSPCLYPGEGEETLPGTAAFSFLVLAHFSSFPLNPWSLLMALS
uniref:ZW10 interacting kinetochore protein n=1 Tax=Podarcis muralis TaxID=64176 RepID=A0A670JZR5_PODMU